jgi:hypothetical protein
MATKGPAQACHSSELIAFFSPALQISASIHQMLQTTKLLQTVIGRSCTTVQDSNAVSGNQPLQLTPNARYSNGDGP